MHIIPTIRYTYYCLGILALSLLSACESNLKVKSQTVGLEGASTSNSSPDEKSSQNPDQNQGSDTSTPPSFALTIKTEDGKLFKESTILNAKRPVVSWDTQNTQISKINLLISLDTACRDILFQFDQDSSSNRAIDFLGDGTYYLCLFGETQSGVKIPAGNNGLKLILDRTPPVINGLKQYFMNQESGTNLNIVDLSETKQRWTQLTGSGVITFNKDTDLNPHIKASAEGDYLLNINVIDSAGNSTDQTIAVTWDVTPPQFSNLLAANEASDGFVNASEAASSSQFAVLNAVNYTVARYSLISNDSPPIICNGSLAYDKSGVPAISTMGPDGSYALCVELSDAAGNITYGKSNTVLKNTVTPMVNAGVDIVTNSQITTGATVTGATTYSWTKVSGPGTVTFGNSSDMNTTVSASADGVYVIALMATNAAGNSASDSFLMTWDTVAPDFTTLAVANGASDGYVNASEYLSPAPLMTLTASGYTTAQFTNALAATAVCDNTQVYSLNAIPSISDLPGSDGSYVVCVKLMDAAGNTTYGKSATVIRDITPPTFSSLIGANGAIDGYINNSEKNSGSAIMTLSASNYDSVSYSAILDNTPPVVCNSSISYLNSSIPAISSMTSTDDTYTLCVKLSDVAGNVTYGTGSSIVRDTVAPIATMSGTPSTFTSNPNFNVTVAGTDVVQYQYAVQTWTSTWCSSYSSSISVATLITSAIGTDGYKTLCVRGVDLAGNVQAVETYYNFALITSTPAASSSMTLRDTGTSVNVSWYSVGSSVGTNSYVVLRGLNSGSTAAWTPTTGTTYSSGNIGAGLDIVYVGSGTSYDDTSATNNSIYEYAVYTVNPVLIYSATSTKNQIAYYPMPTHSSLEAPHINAYAQENSYADIVDISADGLTLVVGAPGHPLDANNINALYNAGAVFVYTRPNAASSWTLEQKLAATGTNSRFAGDYFGRSVAISPDGTMIAAAATQNGYDENGGNFLTQSGAVFIFKKSAGTWSLQQKVVGAGTNGRLTYDIFGSDVAMTNDTLVVAADNQDYDEAGNNFLNLAGAVFVYRLSSGTWSLEGKLVPTGTNARNSSDMFGKSVSIDADTVAVGTMYHQYDALGNNPLGMAGAAYVFTRTGTTWTQQAKIVPSGVNARLASDEFGYDVSIQGDTLAVGAPQNSYDANGGGNSTYRGETFIFKRTTGVWAQEQRLDSGIARIGNFGCSVSLKGNTVLIGGKQMLEDASGVNGLTNAGLAWVFDRSGSTWSLTQKVNAVGTNARNAFDGFGQYVALAGSGTSFAVGSSNSWNSTGAYLSSYAGAAFTFDKAGTWSQSQKVTENFIQSRSRGGLKYGNDIYISSDGLSLFVGAPNDPSDANETNLFAGGVGAVYYYTRASLSSSWTLTQKVIPFGPNSRSGSLGASTQFGARFAVDGTTLVVGSPYFGYDAAGANFSDGAGAVFTYTLSGGVWVDGQNLTASGTNNRYSYDRFGSSLALSGDLLVVGTMYHGRDETGANPLTNAGAAFVFTRSAGSWSQVSKLVETGTNGRSANDYFSYDVATNGTYIAVSANQNDYDRNGANLVSDAGLVWIFKNNAGTWSLNQIIDQPAGRSSSDKFGTSLAMENNILLIGSPGNRFNEIEVGSTTAGAVYIFAENAGTYTNQQKLRGFGPQGSAAGSNFGTKVSIRGNSIAVGATSHAYDEMGLNFVSQAGAVFTYYKSGTTWFGGRKNITFATTGRRTDAEFFGSSVSIAPGILAVGNFNTDFDESTGLIYSKDKGSAYIFQQP